MTDSTLYAITQPDTNALDPLLELLRKAKDWEDLLAFYDYPVEHWVHIRTINPIESTFATVRLWSKQSQSCGSRTTTLASRP